MKRSDTLMTNKAGMSNKQMLELAIQDCLVCDAALLVARSAGVHHACRKT